jgi:hypothetical protein
MLPEEMPPSPLLSSDKANLNPWHPFESHAKYELANFLYCKNQMSGANINDLMEIWSAMHPQEGSPFSSHQDLYERIDSIEDGDVSWQSITIKHPNASQNTSNIPAWQLQDYDVWFCDPRAVIKSILSNPNFKDGFDNAPYSVYDENHKRTRGNFMSGDWAWKQCVSKTSTLGLQKFILFKISLEKTQIVLGQCLSL